MHFYDIGRAMMYTYVDIIILLLTQTVFSKSNIDPDINFTVYVNVLWNFG